MGIVDVLHHVLDPVDRDRAADDFDIILLAASPTPKWLVYSESIEQVIVERPDATLAELKAELDLPFIINAVCDAPRTAS